MSQRERQRSKFEIACHECGVDAATDSPNEIVDFYRRHHRQTGHDVVITRAALEFDGDRPASDDIETVVAALEKRYEDGVPIGVVAAVLSERGFSVGDTLEEIYEVRMTGALYEPRDDHLAAV